MGIMKVSELIYQENGFVVKLRCENEFDADDYNEIKELLKIKVIEWKNTGYVPNDEVVAIMSLVDQLVGGSRFFDEETIIKMEDASLEIQDIVTDLIR